MRHTSNLPNFPCLTALTDDTAPLEFRIDKTNQYLNFSEVYLSFSFKIQKQDGTALDEDNVVAPINNFGYSFFSAVEMFIQDEKVTLDQGNYPWMSYVYLLLNTNKDEKKILPQSSIMA